MNARLYDPVIARMLRWDTYAGDGSTQGFNRYSYAMNNPLKYTDPTGNFLTGIELVSNIVAPIINLAQGNYNGNFGKFLLDVGIGIVNGAIAEVNPLDWNMGGGLRAGASLSFFSGTDGVGFSVQVGASLGVGDWRFASVSVGVNVSTTGFGTNDIDISGVATVGVGLYKQSLGGNKRGAMFQSNWYFTQNGTSQRTGSLNAYFGSFGGKQGSLAYENDFLTPWGPGDSGDRYRSAALRFQSGDFETGFNLFTGDPGPTPRGRIPGEKIETYKELGEQYREGIFYVGYKGYRAGVNSEGVRNIIQNKVAHGNGKLFPIFQVTDTKPALYYRYGTNQKYYTLW